MNKRYINRFTIILMTILIASIYYGVDLFDNTSDVLNYNDSLFQFDEFREGEYIDFDIRELESLKRIIIFPYYSSNTPLEEQKGVIVLSNSEEYHEILDSFNSLTMKSENKLDYSGDSTYVKMIIEVDEDNFYEISIVDDTIDVLYNRIWFNKEVYYSDYNYEEYIRNEVAN